MLSFIWGLILTFVLVEQSLRVALQKVIIQEDASWASPDQIYSANTF